MDLILRAATHRFDHNTYQVIYLRGSIGTPTELFKLVLQGMKIDPPYSVSKAKPLFYDAVNEAKRKPVIVNGAIEQKQIIDTADIPQKVR